MDKIGLVTITYNSANVLSDFLNCFNNQSYEKIFLYVVDNCSIDNTCSILQNFDNPRIIIIQNSTNIGVAKANNQGILKAIKDGCDQVLIINNDVKFSDNLIAALLEVQNQKKCSLVVPKMMYFDSPNHIWYSGAWFSRRKGYLPSHRGFKELDKGMYDKVIEVEYAPTCCLLVKKKVFYDIGMMDEKYFVYFDDTDFSYRIMKDGRHKMFYCPDVKFYHKVGSLTNSFEKKYRSSFFIKQNVKNHIYFLRKIGSIFAYLYIIWLFMKNNIRFLISARIRKDFATWWLINKSYFQGLKM